MSVLREQSTTETVTTQPVTEVADTTNTVETQVPELLATYSEDQGKPYVAKYLDIENVWDQTPSLKYEVNAIEGYIKDQISKGNVENHVKAGEKFLKELEKKAEISPYETSTNKITKLLAYIEFRKVIDE